MQNLSRNNAHLLDERAQLHDCAWHNLLKIKSHYFLREIE